MESPDEVVKMVERCSTEELEKLLKVEPNNLYGIMVHLAVEYEYNRRKILVEVEGQNEHV